MQGCENGKRVPEDMRTIIFILIFLSTRNSFSQIGELTGTVKDSTEYGLIQNAKMHFIKNDTTIYTSWGGKI